MRSNLGNCPGVEVQCAVCLKNLARLLLLCKIRNSIALFSRALGTADMEISTLNINMLLTFLGFKVLLKTGNYLSEAEATPPKAQFPKRNSVHVQSKT